MGEIDFFAIFLYPAAIIASVAKRVKPLKSKCTASPALVIPKITLKIIVIAVAKISAVIAGRIPVSYTHLRAHET